MNTCTVSSLLGVLGAVAALSACTAPAVLAQNQAEMQAEACLRYTELDAELNEVYGQVLEAYENEASSIKRLRSTQRAWLRFRNLHLESIYPRAEASEQGSVLGTCKCSELAVLTQQRIDQLRTWLNRQEGDVCAGSRNVGRDLEP